MCKVPWLNAEELAHGGKVVHDIGEHLKHPITFAKASESSHLTCEELFKVFGSLGQHLGIFSTLFHLASLLKYHQAVKSLASIRCIYVSVTVSLLPQFQASILPLSFWPSLLWCDQSERGGQATAAGGRPVSSSSDGKPTQLKPTLVRTLLGRDLT